MIWKVQQCSGGITAMSQCNFLIVIVCMWNSVPLSEHNSKNKISGPAFLTPTVVMKVFLGTLMSSGKPTQYLRRSNALSSQNAVEKLSSTLHCDLFNIVSTLHADRHLANFASFLQELGLVFLPVTNHLQSGLDFRISQSLLDGHHSDRVHNNPVGAPTHRIFDLPG